MPDPLQTDDERVWVSEIAYEFAAQIVSDYVSQVAEARQISIDLKSAIEARSLNVFDKRFGQWTERPLRDSEPSFPSGDYPLRRSTAIRWFDAQVPGRKESGKECNARRYRQCIEAGLPMPDNDYATLPRGVGRLAKAEGISTVAFSNSVKAHIATLKR